MGRDLRCCWVRCLLAACVVFSPVTLRAQSGPGASGQPAAAPANLAAAMAQYRRALEEYDRAQQRYAAAASAYWNSIAEKRKERSGKRARGQPIAIDDYVLLQPPVYTGPSKPQNPSLPPTPTPPQRPRNVPVVADFLAAAREEFKFSPRPPQSDGEFKRAYAKVAQAAGLSKDQAVRVYSFEATGNGNYDIQA